MRKRVQVSCEVYDFQTRFFCSALSFCLIAMYSVSFRYLKSWHKNLLWSRGPCLLPSETNVMSFSCFSSFTAACFASSSGNMYFFSAVSHCVQCSFLLPSDLPLSQLEPEIPVSSDWYQKLLWRLCPTKPGDKAVFLLKMSYLLLP